MLKLLRLLRGYVCFKITGRHPERFINILNFRGTAYWDFVPADNGFVGKMFISDYKKIRCAARNASVRLKVISRHGLPFFIKRYKRRKGIAAGVVLSAVLLIVLSQFIWNIEIVGADSVSVSRLNGVFEKNGFKVRMLKSSLDVIGLERNVELEIPEIKWLSVNALNNVAKVEIKEKTKTPKLSRKTCPCNIKSDSDGVITDIVVRKGTCEVKRGSAIAKNQLLVNCVVKSKNNKQSFVHSDAEIYADVKVPKTFEIPIINNAFDLTDEYTEKSDMKFLFFELPFGFSDSLSGVKAMCYGDSDFVYNGVRLPMGYKTERTYYFSEVKRELNEKQIKRLFKTRLALFECFCYGNCEIKSRHTDVVKNRDKYVFKTELTVNKNIAVTQKVRMKRR